MRFSSLLLTLFFTVGGGQALYAVSVMDGVTGTMFNIDTLFSREMPCDSYSVPSGYNKYCRSNSFTISFDPWTHDYNAIPDFDLGEKPSKGKLSLIHARAYWRNPDRDGGRNGFFVDGMTDKSGNILVFNGIVDNTDNPFISGRFVIAKDLNDGDLNLIITAKPLDGSAAYEIVNQTVHHESDLKYHIFFHERVNKPSKVEVKISIRIPNINLPYQLVDTGFIFASQCVPDASGSGCI